MNDIKSTNSIEARADRTCCIVLIIVLIGYVVMLIQILRPPYISLGYDRLFCNEIHDVNSQIERFRELTIKYASYFEATDEKASQANSDPELWRILYHMANGRIKLDQMPDHMSRRSFNYNATCDANGQPKVRENLLQTRTDENKPHIRENSQLWQLLLEENDLNLANLRNNLELQKETRERPGIISGPERISTDGKFMLYDGVVFGEKFDTFSQANQVTIAIDTSMYWLNTFLTTSAKWNGPISLAVFLSGKLEYFLFRGYLSYLKRCQREVYDRTIFSIATPIESPISPYSTIQTKDFDHINCTTITNEVTETITYNLKQSKQWLKKNNYSATTIRNLSIANSRTPYHLALDINTIPCPNMSENLNTFLANNVIFKDGFIIPTYKLSETANIPQNKAELVELSRQGLAQPVPSLNNRNMRFTKWEELSDSSKKVKIIEDEDFRSFDETFFIVSEYNTNFARNRTNEPFIAPEHLKPVNFALLSPLFAIHLTPQENQTPSILNRAFA